MGGGPRPAPATRPPRWAMRPPPRGRGAAAPRAKVLSGGGPRPGGGGRTVSSGAGKRGTPYWRASWPIAPGPHCSSRGGAGAHDRWVRAQISRESAASGSGVAKKRRGWLRKGFRRRREAGQVGPAEALAAGLAGGYREGDVRDDARDTGCGVPSRPHSDCGSGLRGAGRGVWGRGARALVLAA